ncbi:MAG TPA: hypothetical protein VMN78_06180 [Longimicrobiales bacterium]|nr:hypothetical protein [Longimicrobiales bacterium]
MRLRLNSLSVIPAVLFILGTAGSNDLVAQSSAGMSARGHVDVEVGGVTTERYSFTARRDGEASAARGQFQLFRNVGTAAETKVHGEVTCLVEAPSLGNAAFVGGVITRAEPALADDAKLGMVWTVVDRGEGRNAEDAGSLMFGFGLLTAEQATQLCGVIGAPALPSGRGNVQVSAR